MRYLLYWLVFLYAGQSIIAQDSAYKNSIAIRHDNDFFVISDRYYTFGNFLDYRRKLESDFIFTKREKDVIQLNFTLGQEGYTPDEQDEFEVEVFDYPFSGWLFLAAEVVRANHKSSLGLKIIGGVTGPASLAGQLQEWYHDFLGIGDDPTWVAQIPSAFLINFQPSYTVDFKLSQQKNVFLSLLSNASLGTKDIFLEQEVLFSFGKRAPLSQSTLFNFVGTTAPELYAYGGVSYRYVAHNTLIEGFLFDNNAPFTLSANSNVLKFRIGGALKRNRNTFRVEYKHNTTETPLSRAHDFVSVIFERNF